MGAMPSSPSRGPRFTAVVLLVAVAIAAVWIAWPTTDPIAAPTAPASSAPTIPTRPTAATSELAPVDRTAVPTAVPEPATLAAMPRPTATARAAATLRGRVVDAQSAPIAGARVAVLTHEDVPIPLGLPKELLETRSEATTTDANGAFAVPLATLGPFELIASHDERPDARTAGNATTASVEGVLIVMQEGGTIRGRIVGAPADAGPFDVVAKPAATLLDKAAREASSLLIDIADFVEGLEVAPDARRTKVDADGTFTIRGLDVAKSYQVFGMREPANALPARCTERVDVRAGAAGLTLRWRETLDVVVRVVDADTGAPLETLDVASGPVHEMKVMGMRIPVPMRQPIAQRQFPGGVVRVGGLVVDDGEAKRVSVEVRAAGHRPWTRDDIDTATRGVVDLGVVRLVAAPIVRVVVTDAAGPVRDAVVHVIAAPTENDGDAPTRSLSISSTVHADQNTTPAVNLTEQNVKTDAAGVAEVTPDFAGRALVTVESAEHARFRGEAFDLPERGTLEQRARLVRGGTVRVLARDGHGAPLANTTVRRRASDESDPVDLPTDAAGVVTFEHVTPGVHHFDLLEPRRDTRVDIRAAMGQLTASARSVPADVVDGTTVELELTAPLRGSLRGVVTFDGQPLDRAEVRIGDATPDDGSEEVSRLVESMLGGLVDTSSSKAKTDSDGMFAFDDVAVGERRITVTHPDLAMPTVVDLRLVEGENVQNITAHGATLRGRVLDADGKPLEGAAVSITVATPDDATQAAKIGEATDALGDFFGTAARAGVRTDADGRFELRGVRPGCELRVAASARMHVSSAVSTPAIVDGSADIDDGHHARRPRRRERSLRRTEPFLLRSEPSPRRDTAASGRGCVPLDRS